MNYTPLFKRIKQLCSKGEADAIDEVLSLLDSGADLPTTKAIDLYLGLVTKTHGIKRIEHYLFNGTPIQRNYCTLFFARRGDWDNVNEAYRRGLVDAMQAYSR